MLFSTRFITLVFFITAKLYQDGLVAWRVKKLTQSEQGFYLIEMLIVIAVLGMVVIPFLIMFSAAAHSNTQERMYSVAAGLAREKMEEAKSRGFCGVGGELEAEVGGFPAFTRTVETEFVSAGLKQVTVVVRWYFAGSQREYRLITYVARR